MRSLARDLDDDPAEAWDDVIRGARFAPVESHEMTTRALQDRHKWGHERALRFLEELVTTGRATWRWAHRNDGRRVKAYRLIHDKAKSNKAGGVSKENNDGAQENDRPGRTRAKRRRRT